MNAIKIDVGKLIKSLQGTAPQKKPKMNKGTRYLFNNVHLKIAGGKELRLSDLNMDAFHFDDLIEFEKTICLHYEKNERESRLITEALQSAEPACVNVEYV